MKTSFPANGNELANIRELACCSFSQEVKVKFSKLN